MLTLNKTRNITPHEAAKQLSLMRKSIETILDYICETLRVGVSINYAFYRLPDLLTSYQEKYPHVNTHITTDQSRNLYLQLPDNTIDVAILRGEYDDGKGEKILLDREKICAIYNQQDENASLSKLPFIGRKTDIELERELIMSTIEDSHPLGRLFDMDVIDSDGNKLSRTAFRKCLICNAQAQICASSRNHSVVEMQHKIVELLNDFFI